MMVSNVNDMYLLILTIVTCWRFTSSFQDDTLRFQPNTDVDKRLTGNLSSLQTLSKTFPTQFNETATSTYLNQTYTEEPVISSCMAFIDVFSDAAANYTHCALQNARPLTFCENCPETYLRAKYNYRTIMEGGPKDDSGRLCSDLILNSDRIRIVQRLGLFIEELWTDCHCNLCYDTLHYHHGHPVANLSEKMLQFKELAANTTECLEKFEYASFNTSLTAACDVCWDAYHAMNTFYDNWEDKADHVLCMDVVDKMNTTRQIWSITFKCHQNPGPVLPMLVVTVLLCLWPIVFYSGIRIFADRQRSNIQKQHRLRLSLSASAAPIAVNVNQSINIVSFPTPSVSS